eukprot:gene27158-33841_t
MILDILEKKDREIHSLRAALAEAKLSAKTHKELREHDVNEKMVADGKSKHFWTQRVNEVKGDGAELRALQAEHEKVKTQLAESQRLLQTSRNEFEELKLSESRNTARGSSSVSGGALNSVQLKELVGLREKCMDLSQQNEVLGQEMARLHREAQDRDRGVEELAHARSEVERMRADAKKNQNRYDQLYANYSALQLAHEDVQQRLLLSEQQISKFQHASAYSSAVSGGAGHVHYGDDLAPPPAHHHNHSNPPRALHTPFTAQVGNRRYESEVGGGGGHNLHHGVSTSTPLQFGSTVGVDDKMTTQEKSAVIAQYQESLARTERELEDLQSRLAESRSVEANMRERMNLLENRAHSSDHDGRVHYERAERLKSEKDEARLALEDRELQLQSALSKAAQKGSVFDTHDAHVWWSYVWHETRKQQQQSAASGANSRVDGASPGDLNYSTGIAQDAGAAFHINKLRDNLRSQAIEITELRQELLGSQLTTKKEVNDLKQQLETSQRNEVHLTTAARIHKGDKDMKIAEMADTIRSLSSRSDIHAQLATARQEIETQKLTNHHLRADLDNYRLMLEEEQRRAQTARKDMQTLQSAIDAMAVYQTVMHVPGVQPAVLLEVMSGQINQLQSDLTKSKASLAESVAQVKALQHSAAAHANRRAREDRDALSTPVHSAFGSTVRRTATRSLSPSGRSPRASSFVPVTQSGAAYDDLLRVSTGSRPRDSLISGARSPRMGLLRPNTASPDLTLDDFQDDDQILAMHPQHSPYKYANIGTGAAFNVVIDAETTPKMLLDSFDVAVLVQRVKTQDSTISELQQRVDDLTENALQGHKEFLLERDSGEYGDRVELDNLMRRFELLTTQHEEVQEELASLRDKNIALEKTLSDRSIDSFVHTIHPAGGVAASLLLGVEDELPLLGQHNNADVSSEASINTTSANLQQQREQIRAAEVTGKDLESTKILLRERTTQLKVLMETLDSLQIAGISSSSHSSASYNRASDEDALLFAPRSSQTGGRRMGGLGLSDLANMAGNSLPAMETSWGAQALVKRVVELTTELTSQCAVAGLEERRAADAESTNRRQSKDVNRLKAALKAIDEETSQLKLALTSLTSQLKEKEHGFVATIADMKRDNDALAKALRESECHVSTAELRINELTEQSRLVDHQDFHSWLEVVTLDNQKILTTSFERLRESSDEPLLGGGAQDEEVFAGIKVGSSSVRELVTALVTQWKEFVGSVPLANKPLSSTTATHTISKTEQRFLQRVTDLVMNANDRATQAANEMHNFELNAKRSELMARISNERLQICAQHLNRYRKRCQAYENVINGDMKSGVAKQTKLESILRKALNDERTKYTACAEALRTEHRDHQILEVKRLLETSQLRKIQAQVAEYESRGSATLRGRDEAIQSLEGKLKLAEDAMFRWFKVELPRLVSGLPVTEDALADYFHEVNSATTPYDFEYKQSGTDAVYEEKTGSIAKQMIASLGMDKTYALSQALCTSKATSTAQEMRIAGLMEKLSIHKERNLELEGVILRWKDQINQSLYQQQQAVSRQTGSSPHPFVISVADGALSNIDNVIQQVYANADNEKVLAAQIDQLRERVMEVEEENIEARGRLHHANSRAEDLKTLVDTVLQDEQGIKTKATQQITKMRVELENEHASELRRLHQ